jgi:RNA polymerase sigma factor (sigma-70 family)
MLRTVGRVVRDPDAARDALQDALVRLWQRRDVVRCHPNPEALVLRVCLHAAIDQTRRGLRRKETSAALLEFQAGGPGHGPSDALERREQRETVLEAIAQLPPRQALAVLMRVVEEQPYSVIASALGCAEVTARIHLMRGRARLCRLLAGWAPGKARTGGQE